MTVEWLDRSYQMRTIRVLVLNISLSAVTIILALLLLMLDRLWLSPLPKSMKIIAWPFLVAGTLMIISAVSMLFKHSGTTGFPGDPTRKLVISGPYRWMRNPIYAGDILLLFGVALLTRSLILLLAAFGSIPAFHVVVCFIEEPITERHLGDEYQEYKKNVPRWIPRLFQGRKKNNP
jgi:protein-S-isoprenylcysteine O-methyltransferase Ste14